jgi:hypothetical protein
MKFLKSLPDDTMVVKLTLLNRMEYVVDDPIKLLCTIHVFWNKHENTLCRKTADSFLNGTITTLSIHKRATYHQKSTRLDHYIKS